MYSSNEYESLELEPKLLISVSALGLTRIKNRRWIDGMEKTVGWLGNGAEGCDFFCVQSLISCIGEKASE